MARFGVTRSITETIKSWARLLNGGLTFSDNLQGSVVDVVIPAQKEKKVTHNLGVVPTKWLTLRYETAAPIVKGATPWTETHAYFLNMSTTSSFDGTIFLIP